MKYRRHLHAVWAGCLLALGSISAPVYGGPLLDWMFRREPAPAPRPVNNPQGVYSSLTGYRGTQTYSHTASYRPTSSCCLSRLFDRLRPSRSQSSLASTSTSDRYTAGYAPQSSCGPGWCRDTVVQYVPQIAYRTAYEPVPVTTYKTTTTINPQTGLPRTCTRPCTSYTYQARRVPYTTYRPVYTTVPVTDTLAQPTPNYAQQQALLPNSAPNYTLQPTANASCPTCSNGSAFHPPADAGYAYGNVSVPPNPNQMAADSAGFAAHGAAPNTYASGLAPTPWTTVPGDGFVSPPAAGGGAANRRPALRPNNDDYGYSSGNELRSTPMTETNRDLFNQQDRSRFRASETERPLAEDPLEDVESNPESDQATENGEDQAGLMPLDPPGNRSSRDLEARRQNYDSRAIIDSVRQRQPRVPFDDRTARLPTKKVENSKFESEPRRSPRFKTLTINWEAQRRSRNVEPAATTTTTHSLWRAR